MHVTGNMDSREDDDVDKVMILACNRHSIGEQMLRLEDWIENEKSKWKMSIIKVWLIIQM